MCISFLSIEGRRTRLLRSAEAAMMLIKGPDAELAKSQFCKAWSRVCRLAPELVELSSAAHGTSYLLTQAWSAFSGLMLGLLSGQPLAYVDVQITLGKAGYNASSLLSKSSSSKVGIVQCNLLGFGFLCV